MTIIPIHSLRISILVARKKHLTRALFPLRVGLPRIDSFIVRPLDYLSTLFIIFVFFFILSFVYLGKLVYYSRLSRVEWRNLKKPFKR